MCWRKGCAPRRSPLAAAALLSSVIATDARAIVPPVASSVTQCLPPPFPLLPAVCGLDASGDLEEDIPGNPCNPFHASWYDEADNLLWTDQHVRVIEGLNGGFLDESRDLNYAVFECNVACVGSPEGCSYSAETGVVEQRGYHRWNASTSTLDAFTMRRVAAVVDGVGVRVQYTGDPTDTGGSGPMIVVIPGAGGDGGLAAAESIRQWFEIRADADTAVIDFETAMPIHPQPTGEWAGGWQSRSSNAPASYEELTARVSAVVDWVREHLAEPGQEIVTVGCSMGCLATLGGPLWHDQDFYALQVFVGGPPMWDINAGCGRMPVSYELPVAPADVTTYGGARLATATFCNDELDPSCIPYGAVQSWRFVNGVHRLPNSALGCPSVPSFATDDPLTVLTDSSLQSIPAADWAQPYPMVFFANTEGDEGLAGPSMVRAFRELRANHTVGPAEVTWSEAPGGHCDAFQNEPDAHRVRDTITEVLDLDTWMFDLRVDKDVENLFTSTDGCLVYDPVTGDNDAHLTSPDPLVIGGGRFDVGPWISASNEHATLPTGVSITMPNVDDGNVVERVMFLTGGSREGTSATARASYLVAFTYQDDSTQDVVVQIPRDDLLAPGAFSGDHWTTEPFLGLVGNGAGLCGSGGSVVAVFNPLGYTGQTVKSVEISYPTSPAQPAFLGGPLALTIWTDQDGFLGGPTSALDAAEYTL